MVYTKNSIACGSLYLKFFLLLVSLCSFLSAMELNEQTVTLPSKKDLLERLQPIKEYEHFLNNSPFIETFAGKTKYGSDTFAVLGFQIDTYRERFKDDRRAFQLEMLKPKVVTLMLQDHPLAIEFLKKNNVLTEPVLLPSAEILDQYIKIAGFDHFASKSTITQQLAHQQKYPTEIFMIIDSQMNEYAKTLDKRAASAVLKLIPYLTKVILHQHPNALKFLTDEFIDESDEKLFK